MDKKYSEDLENIGNELDQYKKDFDGLESRVTLCESDIEELKNRPVGTSLAGAATSLDIKAIWASKEWLDLVQRMAQVEKRNLE